MPSSIGMSDARQFEELVCWQRMHALNIGIRNVTTEGRAAGDFAFRDEIRAAADSAERNIVEGFGYFKPLVFAYFLDFSRVSAFATRSLLRKGLASRYFDAEQVDRLDKLAISALQSVTILQRFLRSPAAKRIVARRYPRPYTAPVTEAISRASRR